MEAVAALLQRHGLGAYQQQLLALGATTPLHLFQLTDDDLALLDGLTLPDRRAFETMLCAENDLGGKESAPTEDQLCEALQLEQKLRTSDDGQRRFSAAESQNDKDWLFVAAEMQQTALIQAGIRPTPENLDRLRDAALRHPELALYVRQNRCRRGHLTTGDIAPNISLQDLNGSSMDLFSGLELGLRARPLVVFAGSYS